MADDSLALVAFVAVGVVVGALSILHLVNHDQPETSTAAADVFGWWWADPAAALTIAIGANRPRRRGQTSH